MTKIAVPTRGQNVDDHFGHCEMYTVFQVENHQITATEIVPSPQGCGCKSNIASVLRQKGVSVLLAGNMGNGALNVLNSQGIKVYRGCSGNVTQVVNAYLNESITDSGEGCHHHGDDGHVCQH